MRNSTVIRRKTRSYQRNKNQKNNLFGISEKPVPKKYGPNGLWGMRTNHLKTFKNSRGEQIELKTAAFISEDKINLADPAKLPIVKSLYHEKIKTISSDRPILVDKFSKDGTPIEGHTPQKTKMYSTSTSGLITYFSNQSPEKKYSQSPTLKKDFHQSMEYKKAPEVAESVKEQFITLHKHSHFNQKKRTFVMNISANDYSVKAGYSSPTKRKKRGAKLLTKRTEWDNGMEWSHLKDHAAFGKDAANNIVATRFSTNTRMILCSTTHRKFAAKYGMASAHVECPLKKSGIKATHIAQQVHYNIAVKGAMHLSHLFKNTRKNPHKSEMAYWDAFHSALMETIPTVPKLSTSKKASPSTSREQYLDAKDSVVRKIIF